MAWLLLALSCLVLLLGFLLLGAIRSISILTWRIDQLEAINPRRIGREGLKLHTIAPDFSLVGVDGRETSLRHYRSRPILLVFTQCNCEPCHTVAPDLNKLHNRGDYQVLAVTHGNADEVASWSAEVKASFAVLVQTNWDISRKYEVFATPFAFIIDAQGIILAKGFISNGQQLKLLLAEGKRHAGQTKPVITQQAEPTTTPI